ncbi:NIF family HAD-type phosphatase [Sphingobium sp. EM0848]|uniref:NIF family HAD-type phosphatase n=1 Tax=Sphingobium sp. EM0848 TaxID=2743473 RepID=UPI00159C63EB|nr:HAD family hydrolase [Sphingobium sp. EM0848]
MDRKAPDIDRPLLILDLDETLIHAREEELNRTADFQIFGYHVYRRPYLADFLRRVRADFDLAVWSSASDDYVAAVVGHIFSADCPLRFVWGRSRATLMRLVRDEYGYTYDPWDHRRYLKPLKKVKRMGWRLERMLIVDDTPEKCVRNYGNAIYPLPFEGDEADAELLSLAAYLSSLKDEPDMRRIEKRRWRELMAASED